MNTSILFRKIASTEPAIDYLSNVIARCLKNDRKILWLVPGGSAIKIAAEVSHRLPTENLNNLTVALTDERYGPAGHKDSNWPQLEAAGFKLDDANLQPVLKGLNLEETAASYSKMIENDLEQADYSVALAGMGPDGHIFGVKPHSPAVNSKELVSGYEWDDFVRLTLTGRAISQLDEVVVYAVGEEKWPQLDQLKKDIPIAQQPGQILKKLKKVTIFNDYLNS